MKNSKHLPKVAAIAVAFLATPLAAQEGDMENMSPRDMTPMDFLENGLEGQWVAIINEDWLWRQRVPPPGDFTSIPYNDRAREVGESWDPSMADSCLKYGAAGVMRQPLRVRISWEGDDELVLRTDYGQQVRNFYFDQPRPDDVEPSLQGYSVAEWQYDPTSAGGRGGPPPASERRGTLVVETTDLIPHWLRTNGAPVSAEATVTEHFDTFADPSGQEWLVVTTIVNDPVYLNQPYVTSSHFKREADRSNWDPRSCDDGM